MGKTRTTGPILPIDNVAQAMNIPAHRQLATALACGCPADLAGRLLLGGLEMRWSRHLPRCAAGRHHHGEPRFILPIRGTFETCHHRLSSSVEPGAALFRPAGDEHLDRYPGPMDCVTIVILDECAGQTASRPYVVRDACFLHAASELWMERRIHDEAGGLIAEGSALLICSIALHQRPIMERRKPHWINTIRDHLALRSIPKRSLSALAQEVNRDPAYVSATFRRFFGTSMGTYVRHLRLWDACNYLRTEPFCRLSDVALRCGFSDHSHFTRHFKAFFGVTPGEYRRNRR